MKKIVFVSGSFDLIHPGHITFLKRAAEYGELYVGIGNDGSILNFKGHKPIYNQDERLYMINAVRYVHQAWINSGQGQLDWIDDIEQLNPDILIVNEDQDIEAKRKFCEHRGIEYIVLKRTQENGLQARSSSELRTLIENVQHMKEVIEADTIVIEQLKHNR